MVTLRGDRIWLGSLWNGFTNAFQEYFMVDPRPFRVHMWISRECLTTSVFPKAQSTLAFMAMQLRSNRHNAGAEDGSASKSAMECRQPVLGVGRPFDRGRSGLGKAMSRWGEYNGGEPFGEGQGKAI